MGIFRGPNIVKNGLVFHIDTASQRSYVSGSATIGDLVNSNVGSINGATYDPQNNGTLIFVSASTNDISVPNNTDFQYTSGSEFSAFCWMKKSSYMSGVGILGNSEFSGGGWQLSIQTDGIFLIMNDDLGQNTSTTTSALNDNQWYYVGFTYNQTSTTVYVDGVVGDTATLNLSTNISDLLIGNGQQSGWGYLDGSISSIMIYNRELSIGEVQQNYNVLKTRFINNPQDPLAFISDAYVNQFTIDPSATVEGNVVSIWNAVPPTTLNASTIGTGVTLNIDSGSGVEERQVTFNNLGGLTWDSGSTLDYTPGTDDFWTVFKSGEFAPIGGMIISKGETTVGNRQYEIEVDGSSNLRIYVGGNLLVDVTDIIRVRANEVWVLQISTTNINIWKNNIQIVTNAGTVGTGTTVEPTNIGTRISTSQKLDPPSALTLVSMGSGTLTSGRRTAIYSYHFVGEVDVDAQSFITAVGTLTSTEQTAVNDLVIDLKAGGVWAKKDAIYPLLGSTATSQKWNLKDARDLDAAFRISWTGSLTHGAGYIENTLGTLGNYANTHLIPSNLNTLMTTNDIGVSFWKSAHVSGGNYTEMGTEDTDTRPRIEMQTGWGANLDFDCYWYDASERATFLPDNYIGLMSGNRIGTSLSAYKDGVLGNNVTNTPAQNDHTILTEPIFLMGHSRVGSTTNVSAPTTGQQYRGFTIGAGLTDAETLAEYNAWLAFYNTIY